MHQKCDFDGKEIEELPVFLPTCSYCICPDHLLIINDLIENDCICYEHFILDKSNHNCDRCEYIKSDRNLIKCLICEEHEFSLKECLMVPKTREKIKEFILNKKNEKAIQLINDMDAIIKDPSNYLSNLYEEIINKLDLRREKLKKETEDKIDEYYKKLIELVKEDQQNKLDDLKNNLSSINIDSIRQNLVDNNLKTNTSKTRNQEIGKNIENCEKLIEKLKSFQNIEEIVKDYDLIAENEQINIEKLFGKLYFNKNINGICLKTLEGHNRWVKCIKVLENGNIISGSYDGTIKIWNKNTGECIATQSGTNDSINPNFYPVQCLNAFNNNEIITGSMREIDIWNIETRACLKQIYPQSGFINSLKIINNNVILSACGDTTIKFWDKNTGDFIKTLRGHTDQVLCLELSKFNKYELLSGSCDKTIKLWSMKTNNCSKTFEGHNGPIWSIREMNDYEFISGSSDKTIKIWNKITGFCIKTIIGHTDEIRDLKFIRTGVIVSCSADKTIKIWDKETGKCIKNLNGHTDQVSGIEIVNDKEIISCSKDKTIKIWTIE